MKAKYIAIYRSRAIEVSTKLLCESLNGMQDTQNLRAFENHLYLVLLMLECKPSYHRKRGTYESGRSDARKLLHQKKGPVQVEHIGVLFPQRSLLQLAYP